MIATVLQAVQMLLLLALAPALDGAVRQLKARFVGRRGAPFWQSYQDLYRLFRKESVIADNASWLFRATPYVAFTATWLAAGLVPTFTTDLALSPAADLIALVALLASARFFTALAALDVGTVLGGLGASRFLLVSAMAEPAMLMVTFTVAILLGHTALAAVVEHVLTRDIGLQASLALAFLTLLMVGLAEAGRHPVDGGGQSAELAMIREATTLEYSGRHLALVEFAGMMRLLLYVALIACLFAPWGMALPYDEPDMLFVGLAAFIGKLAVAAAALAAFETAVARLRLFRFGEFLGAALLFGTLAALFLYVKGVVGG